MLAVAGDGNGNDNLLAVIEKQRVDVLRNGISKTSYEEGFTVTKSCHVAI